jgi:hypothetical protein
MSFNWSTDFTTLGPVDITDLTTAGLFKMFFNAVVERMNVYDFFGIPTYPASGDLRDVMTWWNALANITSTGVGSIAKPQMADIGIGPYSPAGHALLFGRKYDNTTYPTFKPVPYPQGYRRVFPRTIYTLSQSGTDGWRARFEQYKTADFYYGVLASDALFGTVVTTPSTEQKYSGQMFDHVSGSWVVSNDQISDPDHVSDTVASVTGGQFGPVAYSGDYINGQWLNDLRDSINQSAWIGYTGLTGAGGFTNPGTTPDAPVGGCLIVSAGFGISRVGLGTINFPNPSGLFRAIDWYYHDTVTGLWVGLGTTAATNAGSSTLTSPGTFTTANADNTCAIMRYDVTSGFTYVNGYAGV